MENEGGNDTMLKRLLNVEEKSEPSQLLPGPKKINAPVRRSFLTVLTSSVNVHI